MSTNTDIEKRLKEFHKYLLDEIDRREPEVESCVREHGEFEYGEYDEGVLDAFIDIEERFQDKILSGLTHGHN
jgi:hypothetical protein